jgi:hypothetical protein
MMFTNDILRIMSSTMLMNLMVLRHYHALNFSGNGRIKSGRALKDVAKYSHS